MFQNPHKLQEAYKKEREVRNLKKNKQLKRTFICNDNMLQIRDDMSSLQSYQHPLCTKNT